MEKHDAIYMTHSNVKTIRDDVCYDENDNVVTIDESVVTAKMNELAYKDNRKAEYPSIADQLDDLYHNGIDGWKATIKAVKDKYPKE
jgi:hypothetical protein|tara:strand:+ start:487 stop:747 length:261 start_codon:yes stop_codon:yes gene_type:complete